MRIGIYSRKSKFTGKGESIENQIELCRAYIAQHLPGAAGAEIWVYEDEGFSGKNLQRPQFQEMMAASRQRHFDYIVCYRLDRISRSVSDFSSLIEDLNAQKTAFICIKEQFDTSTPMGKAMMYIASVFAQLERETIAERIRDNMAMLAKTGRWLGGATPTGFQSEQEKRVTVDGRARTSCKLAPVEKELELVRFIYQKFLEKQTIGGVTAFLVQSDMKTRQGKDFTNIAVKGILRNPVYCVADTEAYDYFVEQGALVCMGREQCDGAHAFLAYNRTDKAGAYQAKKPVAEWTVALGKHPGVVPGRDWVRVQRLLDEKKNRTAAGTRIPHFSGALLSGLLVCGSCGHFMRPHRQGQRRREDGAAPFYYICEHKERSARKKCAIKNLDGGVADSMVCGELLRLGGRPPCAGEGLEALRQKIARGKAGGGKQQPYIARQIGEKQALIKNLVLALAKNGDDFSAQAIREQINELNRQCQALRAEQAQAGPLEDGGHWAAGACAALGDLRAAFDSAGAGDKRDLLRALVGKIVWDGESLAVFLREE